MIGSVSKRKRADPLKKTGKVGSLTKVNKRRLDYRIRRAGVFSKPPCGAVIHVMVLSDKVKG